jgi:predicted ATPase/class 3 adenylate cyclase
MLRELPTGTVSFLFSDVEGSTGLLQRLGAGYREVLERHAAIVRECLEHHHGLEVSTEGDSFFAVFTATGDAVEASADIQQRLAAEPWPDGGVVAVRIGIHTGAGELGLDNYIGIDVNRAARISAAGHGGQVVVSEAVKALAVDHRFTDLGEHTLRGLDRAERLYQLQVDGMPQTFPPLRTATQRPNNLPALASQIVGRAAERDRLVELIERFRLITVTGPGGIGKTRLALEVAREALALFEQGVFFVDLAPIEDPELLLPAIATAVGVEPTAEGGIAAALSDGSRLIVLDNFEQLSESASRLGELMSSAAPLKALVTSQVPLRIDGERVMRLDPLERSDDTSPAVELFLARAQQVDPSFDLAYQTEDVLSLVDLLDGVPLAIELAAARVNVLSPEEIIQRIGTGVLKSSRVDTPARHRSISDAVEWSYRLLEPGQQEVLQALSVFRGGATLKSLENVLGRDPLDDLGELIDRSLIEQETGTIGKRFDLLTSVQLYAASQIPSDAQFVKRHTDHFASLATEALGPLDSDESPRWRAVLDDDIANLRTALERLLESVDTERGFAMLGGSWRFFQISGRLDELELWLSRFFETAPTGAPTAARTRAIMARGAVHYWRSQWLEAGDDYNAALGNAETLGDPILLRDAIFGALTTTTNAGAMGIDVGDPRPLLARARAIAEENDDPVGLALVEFHEAVSSLGPDKANDPPGPELFEKGVQLMRKAGRMLNVGHLRAAQAEILIARDDYVGAQRYALEGLEAAEEAGDLFGMSWTLNRLAITIFELGDQELATRIAGAADIANERSGGAIPPPILSFQDTLQRARNMLGARAEALYREGRELGLLDAVRMARESVTE